ncbi:MAG: CoA ester lyase [Gammaproteobacteria bacterium]
MIPRSWLFVPGDSERKIARALVAGADAVILDLEDAVAPERKPGARQLTAAALAARPAGSPPLWVRVNPVSSGLMSADLAAVMPGAPDGIVLPKPDSLADVEALDRVLTELEGDRAGRAPTPVLAIVTETALAVLNLPGYAAPPTRLLGLTWGGEDLSAELGATGNRAPDGEFHFTYRLVRSLCQIAAAACGRPAFETIQPDFRDRAALERQARRAAEEGFSGMLAIHPDQVPVINAAFTPTPEQLAHARRVLAAFDAAPQAGTVQLDGRMLDRPHRAQAERLLERAR